jgi:MFS family permease
VTSPALAARDHSRARVDDDDAIVAVGMASVKCGPHARSAEDRRWKAIPPGKALLTRFCFGAGEAGAFPNASIVVSRWFPATQRASISGVVLMASQVGGAIAPLLVVPIQIRHAVPWGAIMIRGQERAG